MSDDDPLGAPDRLHVQMAAKRTADTVDYQSVRCDCGYIELRFNQVPVTECPKCGKLLGILDAEVVED